MEFKAIDTNNKNNNNFQAVHLHKTDSQLNL